MPQRVPCEHCHCIPCPAHATTQHIASGVNEPLCYHGIVIATKRKNAWCGSSCWSAGVDSRAHAGTVERRHAPVRRRKQTGRWRHRRRRRQPLPVSGNCRWRRSGNDRRRTRWRRQASVDRRTSPRDYHPTTRTWAAPASPPLYAVPNDSTCRRLLHYILFGRIAAIARCGHLLQTE